MQWAVAYIAAAFALLQGVDIVAQRFAWPVGNYEDIAQVLDYPCATELAPAAIEAADAILKKDPRIVPLLQLRIADVGTDLGNLTVYYENTIREPLRRFAKEKPQ